MRKALQYCRAAELFEKLSEELDASDIVGQYELYVRMTPWKRYPATLALKQICATLTVRISHPAGFPQIEPI